MTRPPGAGPESTAPSTAAAPRATASRGWPVAASATAAQVQRHACTRAQPAIRRMAVMLPTASMLATFTTSPEVGACTI
jgi:hypothetical protein